MKFMYKALYGHVLSFLSDKYLEMEQLYYMVGAC